MNILAIETTGAEASVAIIHEQGKIVDAISHENLNHLSFLMPLIGEALERAGLTMKDIDAVAASEGPGSFTGIRIGVSSARALAQALDMPCISVPTLKTFLYNLAEVEDCNGEACGKVIACPLFDARRSQVFGGAYTWHEEVVEGNPYMLAEILELLAEKVNAKVNTEDAYQKIVFFGDGVDKYGEDIKRWAEESLAPEVKFEFADQAYRYQHARSVVKMAKKLYEEGQICHYNELKPNYMRKAEAERKLEAAKAEAAATEKAK